MNRLIQLLSQLKEHERMALFIAVVWLVILQVGTMLGLLDDPY